MVRDCPTPKTQGRESNQVKEIGPYFDAPKMYRFYRLKHVRDQ